MRSFSLYLLYKSVLRMTIIVLQAFDLFPDFKFLSPLSKWASHASMVDVSWSAFVAVCVALTIGTFNRGLDGE
jgi:steroid 5-alpha reductase family enzyme